jgi:hypothetical protein
MAVKFVSVLALALSLAACAQNDPAQSAPSNQAPPATGAASAPSQAPPQGAAPQAAAPQPAPSAVGTEKPGQPAAPGAAAAPGTAKPAVAAPAEPAAAPPAPAVPPPPPAPQFREVTIPAGTAINVRLSTPLASDKNKVEDEVRGTLTAPVVVNGLTAVPAGAVIVGTVMEAKRSGRVKGLASVTFRFDRLRVRNETHTIQTASVRREAAADRSDDVKKGVVGGAAGAVVGGIVGGGSGAAIGAGVGSAGAVMATRGDELELPAGTTVRTTLQEPLKVVVQLKPSAER